MDKYVIVVTNTTDYSGTDVVGGVYGPYDDMTAAYSAQDVLEKKREPGERVEFEVRNLLSIQEEWGR